MTLKPVLFFLLLFISYAAVAQHPDLTERIDSLIQMQRPRALNGIVMIAREGKPIYSAMHGVSDVAQQKALQAHDQFIIGSLSKQITAVLLLQEVDQGRVSLEDTLNTYLPDLQATWADSVTIHHLLNHSSGIVSLDKPLAFTPGSQFTYSPLIGYELLASVLEKISGETYADLAERLFAHCGMEDATVPVFYGNRSQARQNLVYSYTEEEEGVLVQEKYALQDIAFATPSGAIISTAQDLTRWNACLHQGKLLKEASYQAMTTASVVRAGHRWGDLGYGYGLQINEQNGIVEYSHSGALVGFIATSLYYPADNLSVIVLENVAPNFEDMSRAFFFHDQIRSIVQAELVVNRHE